MPYKYIFFLPFLVILSIILLPIILPLMVFSWIFGRLIVGEIKI